MFTYFTKETALAEAAVMMERSIQTYGFLPKFHQILAAAPAAYRAYLDTIALFENATTLSPLEQQVVFQPANFENNCHYCIPGHSLLMTHKGMPPDVIEGLREGTLLANERLEALRRYTRLLIERRGHVNKAELNSFLDAGYTHRQALEVLVGLAAKVISNFTNSLAQTELDDAVKPYAWVHPKERQTKKSTTAAKAQVEVGSQ